MFFVQEAFVQATFSVTSISTRLLLHPISPSVSTPTGESWKVVNDRILSQVPSLILLDMAIKELERELNGYGLRSVGGWIFSFDRTVDITTLMERYSRRYHCLTRGIVAEELKRALETLFTQDPRFQARLSACDIKGEAIEEVTRRVLSQLRFTWEVDRLHISDTSALGIRLMVDFQDVLYRRLSESARDAYLMPATRFKRYEHFLLKMQQFRGLDKRFDLVLADYEKALSLFPQDGRSIFGDQLKQFRSQLKGLANYISEELQKDFWDECVGDDEDSVNLEWAIQDALIEDVNEQNDLENITEKLDLVQLVVKTQMTEKVETISSEPIQMLLAF